MATTVVTSKQFTLNIVDLLKGAAVAALAAVTAIVIPILESGGHIDWKIVGTTALSAFIGYLLKNFLESSRVNVVDLPKAIVNEIKSGEKKIEIKPT